jgi:glycosyltransferase involved in cell wall biosynthesis
MNRIVILNQSFRNWIVEATFTEAAEALNVEIEKIFVPDIDMNLRNFLYKKKIRSLKGKENTHIWIACHRMLSEFGGKILPSYIDSSASNILITHINPDEKEKFIEKSLDRFARIFCYNKTDALFLKKTGISSEKIIPLGGAINRAVFYPKHNNNQSEDLFENYVLIAGDCKPRKRPSLIFQVAEMMPDQKFVFHGDGWHKNSPEVLKSRKNVLFLEFDSVVHPKLMREASVYLNLSLLEGGPFTTLEALASGTPVVLTDVGWNREYVTEVNGIILSVNADVEEIVRAIHIVKKRKKVLSNLDLIFGKAKWETLGALLYNKL